jgi:hypothetical protein
MVPANKMRTKAHDRVHPFIRSATSQLQPLPLHLGFVIATGNIIFRSQAAVKFHNLMAGADLKVLREATPEEVDAFFDILHEQAHAAMTAFDQLPKSIKETVRDMLGEPEEIQAVLNSYLIEGELKCLARLNRVKKELERNV